ncbi:DNA polymerase I [Candidatus Synchoanobacter obligatus]|uniref:DNA polymerase I n=1 Tax=Candidatus Synchoanobacter obligatus TaxID=2919597 RepID=A0ABT1L5G5_9GAMM|nr:DNA polymerase I [Candidatus Synchoanobacter obligatus]MCP8352156.1 DNA polymerase I [Candidatus Synchoanobacter obligatus]
MKEYDVILVDGSSYLFRAFHALPPLVNKDGIPTGAIYGVINMIKRLEKDCPDAKIIVVFDPKGGTFRHEIYDGYKADRGQAPDDLVVQIPLLHEVIVALGFPLIIHQGYEADDVIASFAKRCGSKRVLISTLDKDLAQLVSENVHLINTMHNKLLDVQGVQDKFGVLPEQIRDYLALMGDRSDNVPGVPGVGPKTAAKWLCEYGSIEGIKASRDQLKGKVGETFRQHLGEIDLSVQLVSLVDDLEVCQSIDEVVGQGVNAPRLQALYKKFGFKRWLSELSVGEEVSFSIVRKQRLLAGIRDKVSQAPFVVLMASKPKSYTPRSMLTVFALQVRDQCFVLDAEHLDMDSLWQELMPALEAVEIVTFDAKMLLNYWALLGQACRGRVYDLQVAGYVLDSSSVVSLELLQMRYLDKAAVVKKEDAISEALAKESWNVGQLYPLISKEIRGNKTCSHVFNDIEMPVLNILANMEQEGILVDDHLLQNYAKELKASLDEIEAQAHALIGVSFNLSSPKQIRQILFEQLKLPVIEKTPGGEPSTAESTLAELSGQHALVPLLLRHRSLSKIYSTYAEGLVKQVSETGRIHGIFNQAVTVTGRLSSTNPNLQNIPIRTDEGRRIRSAFIPSNGYKIVSADYSQIELRIMAHYSGDHSLIEAFQNNQDVHSATAAKVEGVRLADVSQEMRRRAKAVNFGLIYGMSAFGLSKQLGISRSEAQEVIDKYFEQYPGVLTYMSTIRAQAEEKGYVETILGRRLKAQGAQSHQSIEKQAALRAAINAPMQGSAADIIKLAMIAIATRSDQFDYKMVLQVHDELVFEVKEMDVGAFQEHVTTLMQNVLELKVPLVVNVSEGENWEVAH